VERSRLFTWRILRLHLALIICVTAFVLLADWQFRRALAGNELSWAYAFEWPLFTVYAFVLWRRLLLDELGLGATSASRGHRFLPTRGTKRAEQRELARAAQNEAEDRERERYNAYLAALHDEKSGEHHRGSH
jgi:hypothetical protein